MKTTYKIIHYTGPIHILRRWCQELLAYHFSCIHRSHLMMVDVDYLSRMHNDLVKSHVVLANMLLLADRAARPGAYDADVLADVLQRGKYTVKLYDAYHEQHLDSMSATFHIQKKTKTAHSSEIVPHCHSPIQILANTSMKA